MTPIRTPLLAALTLTLTLIFIVTGGSLSFAAQGAQTPQTPPPAGGGAAPGAGPFAQPEGFTPAELARHFEAYELLQAQQALQLTDEQYADFIVRLKALQNARRRHQQNRQRLLGDLRRMTAPQNAPADEATLRTALDALQREEATGFEEIRKATAHLEEALDLRQRARFRVFEENLERRKLDLLSRVRQARDRTRQPKS